MNATNSNVSKYHPGRLILWFYWNWNIGRLIILSQLKVFTPVRYSPTEEQAALKSTVIQKDSRESAAQWLPQCRTRLLHHQNQSVTKDLSRMNFSRLQTQANLTRWFWMSRLLVNNLICLTVSELPFDQLRTTKGWQPYLLAGSKYPP